MPKRARRGGPKSRRSYKRRRRMRKGRPRTVRIIKNIIPDRTLIKMRYCSFATLNPTAGTQVTRLIRANGLFDPDATGTGHQPVGFDQYLGTSTSTGFYNHYTVLGAKITAIFDRTDAVPAFCGIHLNAGTTTLTGVDALQERPRTLWKIIPSDKGQTKMTYKFSAKKFFGVKTILGEDSYKGDYNSLPTEQCYFHVFAGAADTSTDTNVNVTFQIDYIVMLTEPKAIGQS